MQRAEHQHLEQDDSGFTSVVVCVCRKSFLGFGEDRIADARAQLSAHIMRETDTGVERDRIVDRIDQSIVTERYLSGESLTSIARSEGVGHTALRYTLRLWGLPDQVAA